MKTVIKIPKVKQRVTWGFNPSSRVVRSKKIYNRKKDKYSGKNDENLS